MTDGDATKHAGTPETAAASKADDATPPARDSKADNTAPPGPASKSDTAAQPAGGPPSGGAARTYKNLLFEVSGRIATITINRIRKFNALDAETEAEIDDAVQAAIASPDVGAIILTGAGERAFCAGADIEMISGFSGAEAKEFAYTGQFVFHRIEMSPKPTLAAVNGLALGGGCELAIACHLRVAAEERAQFALPEVTLGVIPGHGGTVRLPRIVGRGIALEMILTGGRVDARRAYEIGLVNRVVPAAELMAASRRLLAAILDKGPLAVRYALESAIRAETLGMEDALYLEAALFGMACGTEDMKEGTRAFLEKRKPEWKGR